MISPSCRSLLGLIVFLYAPVGWGIDQINLSPSFEVSSQLPEFGGAYKGKIESVDNGVLVVVYGDFVEDDAQNYVFDMKSNTERPARDVFVTTCDDAASDCTDPLSWTAPINLSDTARLSSIQTDWNGDGNRTSYFGDSDNPHMFSSGNHVVISWGDKYCPGGEQRSVTYLEFDSREIAMSCLYVAHASNEFSTLSDWTVDRLTDGSRDVKQDNNKGKNSGNWAVVWQEDPLGLQPGEAEGPGEGSSGAKVSHGTDIWYSYAADVEATQLDIGVWKTPVRITDNQTGFGLPGSFNPLKNVAGGTISPAEIEKGTVGASRPNMQLVSGSNPPNALVAYEETKGSQGLDSGKFLRYHVFPYDTPPTSATDKAGCIVSDPTENARRARIVQQTNAASGSGLRMALFWRQGLYDQGGPADIMLRLGYQSTDSGSTGLKATDLYPAVDPQCSTSDYAVATILNNAGPLNISSRTPVATEDNLFDTSDADSLENARAHRAVLRSNDLYLGYIYTEDGVVADATDLANYNFYVRHFNAASGTWMQPVDLSQITNTAINVLEPRLMGTPGNQTGCTDPDNITNPENCQNKSVVLAAWGTENNVYEHIGGAENLDVFLTRTTDKGAHWEPVTFLAAGPNSQGESQLRITPDGNRVFAVWNETRDDITNTMFSLGTPVTLYSDMALSVSDAPVTAYAGTAFDIDYQVENLGPDRAYDINLSITLPAAVTFLSADDFCAHDAGIVTCALGDMDVNSLEQASISIQSTQVELLAFDAVIESETLDDPETANNRVQTSVNATLASDVGVIMTSDSMEVLVGGSAAIHYQLDNAGPSQAEAVQLVQPLPPGVSFLSANPDICSSDGNEVICNVGTLGNGEDADVTVDFRIDQSGQTRLEASVDSSQFDPNRENNVADLAIDAISTADLAVKITPDALNPIEGDESVIEVEALNLGPQGSSGVILTINTPDGWAQSSLTTSQGSCHVEVSVFTCEIDRLDAGSSVLVTLKGTLIGELSSSFRSSISANELDPDMTNNEAVANLDAKADGDETFLQGLFGCSISSAAQSKTVFDPTLLILLMFALYRVGRERLIFELHKRQRRVYK